jgi:acyl-CoA reductase-like NAD-dependent aldehyde dehydrogenase
VLWTSKNEQALSKLIAGEWIDGEAAPNINPSGISDVIGEYARATKADTVAAIDAADSALRPDAASLGSAKDGR